MGENSCNAQPVRIEIVPGKPSIEYTSLGSLKEAKTFAINLSRAKESQIGVDSEKKIETAVKIVLGNTIRAWVPEFDIEAGNFSEIPDERKPMLAAFLWEIQELLFMCSMDMALYCLNKLDEIAPNAFAKARLLLLSQCENADPFVPLATADWNIVGDAILMLKEEKNGYSRDAKDFLERLKSSGNYNALLGNWARDAD